MSETTPARNFRELKVWQKGHSLVLGIYTLTGGFPKHELFGLTSQIAGQQYLFRQISQRPSAVEASRIRPAL